MCVMGLDERDRCMYLLLFCFVFALFTDGDEVC